MRWRRELALVLVVVGGCGRLGFDNASQQATDASGDATDTTGDGDITQPVRTTYVKPTNTEAFDNFGSAIALSRDGTTLAVGALQEDSAATGVNGDATDNNAPQAGAVYIFVRSGTTWSQQAYLKPLNTSSGDVFGFSLALSDDGNRLVVGAPLEDGAGTGVNPASGDVSSTFDAGAAYVFDRAAATWTQTTYLKATNTEAADDFGVAVAISGDGATIAIGAGHEDSAATNVNGNQTSNTAMDSGAVYIFRETTGVWSEQAYVKASNTGAGDDFGGCLALSTDGNTLVVGAASEDSGATTIDGDQADDSVTEAGAVYVFVRTTSWAQQAYIKPSALDYGDFFGKRLALSSDGNTLAVTAPGNDGTIANSGAVFLYGRTGSAWSELATLKAPNAGDNDQFGFDVALAGDGNTVLVGAGYEDSAGAGSTADPSDDSSTDSGAIYTWARETTAATWFFAQYAKPPITDLGDLFGSAVALSTDHLTAAVSLPQEDSSTTTIDGDATDNAADGAGAVYIFEY